jgi:hypothetical protein
MLEVKLKEKCKIRTEKDGYGLLADIETGGIFVINPTAVTILSKLKKNDSCPIEEIMNAINIQYDNVGETRLLTDIKVFYNQLKKYELVASYKED